MEGWDRGARRAHAAKLVAVAAVYYGAAKLGLTLAFEAPSVTAIWPPTGIALAAVLLWGYRIWPGVALGAFLANNWTGVPIYTTLGINPRAKHFVGSRPVWATPEKAGAVRELLV